MGIVFDKAGRTTKITDKLNDMPRLLRNNFKNKNPEQPLWKLLKLENEKKNPTNVEETILFLQKHKQKEKKRLFEARVEIYNFKKMMI